MSNLSYNIHDVHYVHGEDRIMVILSRFYGHNWGVRVANTLAADGRSEPRHDEYGHDGGDCEVSRIKRGNYALQELARAIVSKGCGYPFLYGCINK
jgi:hypothetical protein